MKERLYVDSVINYVKKYYREDIDLIVAYGSFIRGDMHEKSDVDLFFVPANEKGYLASFEVIIDEVGFDFFPIPWERVKQIARYDEPLTSLLLEGQIIYHRNDQVFNQFEELRTYCVHFSHFEEKLKNLIFDAKYLYFDYPKTLPEILTKCALAIAYYNHVPLRRGMMDFETELQPLDKPTLFIENIKLLIESPSKRGLRKFIADTEKFVFPDKPSSEEIGSGFYEELKSMYQKGLHTTSPYKQFFIQSIIEKETQVVFGKEANFPKPSKNFYEWIQHHERKMVDLLKEKNIPIREYQNIEDFLTFFLKI